MKINRETVEPLEHKAGTSGLAQYFNWLVRYYGAARRNPLPIDVVSEIKDSVKVAVSQQIQSAPRYERWARRQIIRLRRLYYNAKGLLS